MKRSNFLLLMAFALMALLAMPTGQALANDGGSGAVALVATGGQVVSGSVALTPNKTSGVAMAMMDGKNVKSVPQPTTVNCSEVQSAVLLFWKDGVALNQGVDQGAAFDKGSNVSIQAANCGYQMSSC